MQSPSATLQRHTAQQSEYRAMITALRAVLDASTSVETCYLTPQTHSRLGAAHDQAQNLLQALFEDSADPLLAAHLQASRGSLLQVDATAGHCSFSFNRPDGSVARYAIEDVSRASSRIQEFQRALLSIGAHLRSDRLLPLSQLLRESGFTFADVQDATALARLIAKVEERRASHRLNLRHHPALTALMSDDDKAAVHDLIGDWLTGKTLSAIDSLAAEVTPPFTRQQLEQQPAACLERLLDTPKARDLGQRLLQKLQWYGARPDEPTVPDIDLRLLLEALCLWYELPGDSDSTEVAGFALEQRAHHGASYATIRRDFLQHLEETHRTSTTSEKHLLGWACLAQFGLDFQVQDIPDDLPYACSVVWVNFVHGVHLAHALDPQLLEHLSFQQLVDLPLHKSENASPELQTLIAMTRAAAAQTWTLATGAQPAANETSGDDAALQALEDHKTKLNAAILQLDIEPPRRLALAKQQLDKALANDLYDHTTIRLKRHHPSTPNRSRRSIIDTPDVALPTWPLLEVYASGGLSTDSRWYVSHDGRNASEWVSLNAAGKLQSGFVNSDQPGRPLSRFPSNRTLPDIKTLFDHQFDGYDGYLSKTRKAYEYLIKSLLVTLPWADRLALEHGEVRILGLRDPTRHIEAHLETPKDTLPHRARMGFVLHVNDQSKPRFYECLPRAGIIRKRPDLTRIHIGGLTLPPLSPRPGRTKAQSISRIVARRLPFDREAHWNGSIPAPDAKCVAILEPLGDPLPASMIPAAHHDSSPNLTFTSPRTTQIASLIADQLFYVDEQALRSEAWGRTRFERDTSKKHWIHAIRGFIPFWGSLEDLQSDKLWKRALGVLGLFLDIVSFAIPLGKFVAGSIRLAAVAGKMSIRVALPRMARLSENLLVSTLKNVNPLAAVPLLLKLGGRGAIGAVRAVAHLEHRAVARLKRLAGRSADYDLLHSLPQALDAGRWKALKPADHLAVVRGIDDVPVRNIGGSRYHVLDPLSDRPYGPQLLAHEHDFSLGRSHYSTVKKTDDKIDIELMPDRRVELMPEAGGRTTVLIDDVPYRLDGDELRRVDLLDDSQHWTLLPCRIRRAPGAGDCRVSYITADPAPTPALGTIDKEKGYAPWFGERVSEPATLPRQDAPLLAVDAKLYQIVDNRPRLFTGDLRRLGINQGKLVPRQQIQATLQFRKGIYARIKTGGTYDGINDSHQVGAVLMPAIDGSATHVFFRVNNHEYYLATFAKGEIPGKQLTFKRLAPAELADGTLGAELLTVYTGSLHANNMVRLHGLESVQRAMHTMEQIAIPIGTTATPANNMKWLKVDTSPGEALMFDHSTRMIVTRLPEGAATWARSKEAPEAFRQKTAEIFDTLFLSPTINPANTNAALRIDSTMQKLHNLLPMRERPVNARNIAYAEVTTVSGKREIYVSVSGAQGSTQRLPLFRHMGANHVRIGDTTYINIDYNPAFARTSLEVTEQGQLLAVPLTIKDLKSYQPTQTSRPTSLDSESKLISVLREKYPDPTEIRAVDIATTMRPCESCSVVMKQFAHDGGEAALQVLWG